MKRIALCLATCGLLVAYTGTANADLSWGVRDGNLVTVYGTGEQLSGIDFTSASGNLVPVPPGGVGAPAAPFTLFLANHANQVAYGILGANLTIDGSIDMAHGVTEFPGDVVAGAGIAGEVVAVPAVPEPATGLLAALGSLAFLAFRRR